MGAQIAAHLVKRGETAHDRKQQQRIPIGSAQGAHGLVCLLHLGRRITFGGRQRQRQRGRQLKSQLERGRRVAHMIQALDARKAVRGRFAVCRTRLAGP